MLEHPSADWQPDDSHTNSTEQAFAINPQGMIKSARRVSVKEEPMDKTVKCIKTHHRLYHVQ